jgi:hypothetical protein
MHMMYDDLNRPGYDPVRAAGDDSALGGLLVLVAIFALLFLGTYFFAPPTDGTRSARTNTSQPVQTMPAPSTTSGPHDAL